MAALPANLRQWYDGRRYTTLFCMLAAVLVALPVTDSLGFGGTLIDLCLAFTLLAAVLPMSRRPGVRLLLVALFAFTVFMRIGSGVLDHAPMEAISLALGSLIALLAAASALIFALRGQEVEREHVLAALSAYLLVGVYFGVLHWAIEQVQPGSYSLTGPFTQSTSNYFSFVTLATIGFGDIVPKSDIARGLTVVEGIGGQLFLAVLVARLVSQHGKRSDPG